MSKTSPSHQSVLGIQYRAPQIYISGGDQGYTAGGMVSLASTDEPAVIIGGYNLSGTPEVSLYEADEAALLDFLTHDKDGKQTKKTVDTNALRFVTTAKASSVTTDGSKVTLPLSETGIWYLKVTLGSTKTDAFVVRSNFGVIAEESDNEFIFWGQNYKTKRSISEGSIRMLNLEESRRELQSASFDQSGIAKAALTAEADIAIAKLGQDTAIIPINLLYLNSGYRYTRFQEKRRQTKYFTFTDRPLYKPGDTIYFKSILRNDDDARYTIPSGQATVKIYDDYYYTGSSLKPLFEKSFSISEDGTINGQYKLPANAKTGSYSIAVEIPNQAVRGNFWDSEWTSNVISFNVEFFKKPEFTIDVTTPNTELIAGDKTSFTISGQYFSGQALQNQTVKYTVSAADFYEYEYVQDQQSLWHSISDDYRYGYFYGSNKVTEGTATLSIDGQAVIDLDTKTTFNNGKSQVFSIEATLEDGSQTPSFARKNILVYAGEYGIYRKDYSYGSKVNTPVSLPLTLVPYRDNFKISNVPLMAAVHRESWQAYNDPSSKYPLYKKEEEDLSPISAKTDSHGNATLTFTPKKVGSYSITVSGQDARGNTISKLFYTYVAADDLPYYTSNGNNDLTISTDRQKYEPTDTAKINIFSIVPDRDVFLSLERGRVNRYQIVHLDGKNGSVEIPLVNTDVPNIYAKVASFSDIALDTNVTNLEVSSASKKLLVTVTPNNQKFGPGETVTVNVATTDVGGNPVGADVALWAVDKAIFELSDNRLGDVFKTFWQTRGDTTEYAHSLEGITVNQAEGGGCFAKGTLVLMANGKTKKIEDVKAGDYVLTRTEKDAKLVKTKVVNTHQAQENGYLIINGSLRVTANHIIRLNGTWQEAGNAQVGDSLVNTSGGAVPITSIEWQRGQFTVYNLEVEGQHTFFANGVWVHNQKGVERNVFKDTAYWNPTVHTNQSGRAQVSFTLPDNLTTWTIAAVGSTRDTRVGQTTADVVVTKDVIVRPIVPNILRVGDEIVLSALVQNFTQQDIPFAIEGKFDAGDIELQGQPNITIKASQMQQVYWKVKPKTEADKAKLVFSARSVNDAKLADVVTEEMPLRAFGFEERTASTGEGAKTFQVKLAPDSSKSKSTVTLSLAPTIVGALPSAMRYLIQYPYGCVEQTTSRFVPAVIAKANPSFFAEALKDKDIDDIIEKGITRLTALQQGDGGWAWWASGRSDPFITAYVIEYILQAKQAGIKVDDSIIQSAQHYLENKEAYNLQTKQKEPDTKETQIAKMYALTLLGSPKATRLTGLQNLSPDFLALAVMANYRNGDKNPKTNGLDQLVAMAQTQGDALYWVGGSKANFGSNEASTALAIRAIVLAGGDRDVAAKAARYLTRSRKTEYWVNTYATAQVVRALVDFSKTGSELTPNYSYTVTLDGKQLVQGNVTAANQVIKDITVPVDRIKGGGSALTVTKNGDGQLYSTLVLNEFHTDTNAKTLDHGMSIRRQYVNEKGSQYSLAVGDTVKVQLTVGGLAANEQYAVIHDELPSGLVPINETFKNEQYGTDPNAYYTSYDVTDRDVTENGMVLSLYNIGAGNRTYSYKARVVSEGTFLVPPATASLMYAPDVYGRSSAETVTISKKSEVIPTKALQHVAQKAGRRVVFTVLLILTLLLVGVIIVVKRGAIILSLPSKVHGMLKRKSTPPEPAISPPEDVTTTENPANDGELKQ